MGVVTIGLSIAVPNLKWAFKITASATVIIQVIIINYGVILMEYELRGDYPLKREEFDRRMKNAEKYLFSLGVDDPAEEVGRINAILYIAKVHYIQEKLGYQPRGMFIGAPDFTFQTSPHKFYVSVPEGGKIIWGDGPYDLIFGEMEFDFCGMLVGAVRDKPDLEEILDIIHEMNEKNLEIDGRKIGLRNFSTGSHFLNLYEVENHEVLGLPKVVAVLHTSSDEMRDPLINFVHERAKEMQTPFGKSYILQGDDTREYEKRCKYASEFSKRKRKLLFEEIFGSNEIIMNHNHYELTGPNEAIIGCNIIRKEGEVFVITLGDSLSAYLIKGKMNISSEKIKEIVPRPGAIEGWAYEELRKADIIPHGGGHKLNEVDSIAKVILYPDGKVIIPRCASKNGTSAYVDMKEISRGYRSGAILDRVRSLELGEPYATLRFIYGIKVDFESK